MMWWTRRLPSLAAALLLLSLLPGTAMGGASCCMTKAGGRTVPDPYASQPEDWDEDDDGPWSPADVEVTSIRGTWRWQYEAKDLVASNAGWLLAGLVVAGLLRGLQPSSATVGAFLGTSGPATAAATVGHAVCGALVGLLLPCCSCGVMPLAASVIEGGASTAGALAMAFVASGSGLDSAAFTAGSFGYAAAAARMTAVAAVGVVFAVVASLAAGRAKTTTTKTTTTKTTKTGGGGDAAGPDCCGPDAAAMGSCGEEVSEGAATRSRLAVAVEGVLSAAEEVLPSIALGVAATAASTAWGLGEGWLQKPAAPSGCSGSSTGGGSGGGGAEQHLRRLGFLAASLPLQMCEHAVVTLAKGLVDSGAASLGAAAAWVVLSPATSMGLFLLVHKRCGAGAAAAAAVAAVLSSCLVAEAVDRAEGAGGWASWAGHGAGGVGGAGYGAVGGAMAVVPGGAELPQWFNEASPALLGALGVVLLGRRLGGMLGGSRGRGGGKKEKEA